MATLVARPGAMQPTTLTPPRKRDDRITKRKKDQRADIWSNLLRQTREAQARSRTQAIQCRSLVICGGSDEDQKSFVQSIARPPPPAPPSRTRDQRPQKPKGEVKLSNRFAYGYGHVTLYSPPQQGAGLLETESEEAAKLEIHTFPEPDPGYLDVLRSILETKTGPTGENNLDDDIDTAKDQLQQPLDIRPSIAVLLSWREPWKFLSSLQKWLQLLSLSLLPPNAKAEDPLEVLKEFALSVSVIVQHVEAQEILEREGYKEENFDQVSQFLRTCTLPLGAGIAYVNNAPQPQQSGAALTEVQKLVYTCLDLDLLPLSPAIAKGSASTKREDLAPKHNVVDRMAIIVPSGWDSVGKIRLLSETFSPESTLEAWRSDLAVPFIPTPVVARADTKEKKQAETRTQPDGDAEQAVFATSDVEDESELIDESNTSSRNRISAVAVYEESVVNPYAHKAPKPPAITITTKPDQDFLADMRAHLQDLEAHDAARAKHDKSSSGGLSSTTAGRIIGLPAGEQTGALDGLGDVSFNVGGVSYNTVSAEAAIERLRRPRRDPQSPGEATPRTTTPRPRRGEDSDGLLSPGSLSTPSGKAELPSVDKLEEYFASLMKKGGGGISANNTPSKAPQ